MPAITDPISAASDIPLATFSVITHGRSPDAAAILKALATALKTIDEETAQIFAELGLGTAPAAKLWRDLMSVDLKFFRSETSQRIREEGRVEGRAESRAEDILRILDRRGIALAADAQDRVRHCTNLDDLDLWFDRAITITNGPDLFE